MNKYEVQLPFVDKIQLRKYGALNTPPILALFWQVFNIGKKKRFTKSMIARSSLY